jgi:hypothetical protein
MRFEKKKIRFCSNTNKSEVIGNTGYDLAFLADLDNKSLLYRSAPPNTGCPPIGSAAQIQGLISIASRGGGYWGGRPPLSLPRPRVALLPPALLRVFGGVHRGYTFPAI